MKPLYHFTLSLCALAVLLVSVPSTPRDVVAQTRPTAQPTPLANQQPDRCERNDTPARACDLALDGVNGPFTFLPAGDQDYYRLDLGAQPGLALSITVRSTGGLDLLSTVSRDDGASLATISSPAISTTLAAELTGTVWLRVENRAPQVASGESYGIELRRVLPPAPTDPRATQTLAPDRLEDNWSPAAAAPLGVGVVYDLNFVCPVAWGCAGGDHDYLVVPVKRGLRYVFATFDLGPGVDTVLDLFWGREDVPVASNDDVRPGKSFLSLLRWTAPGDGVAIVRVAPRTGGLTPLVFDEKASAYHFAAVLADSDLAQQITQRVAEQSGVPAPNTATNGTSSAAAPPIAPAPPVANAPAPSAAPPLLDAPKGQAQVQAEHTVLREQPTASGQPILTLQRGATVTLLGQVSGAWARVQPAESVVPGWVYGPDLRPLTGTATLTATPTISATPTLTSTPPLVTPAASALPRVRPLEPLTPDAPASAPRVTVALTITLLAVRPQALRATPVIGRSDDPSAADGAQVLANQRVQLVNVFGDVLAEAFSDARGTVAVQRDVAAETAVFVRVPALGVRCALERTQSVLTIRLPKGGSQ